MNFYFFLIFATFFFFFLIRDFSIFYKFPNLSAFLKVVLKSLSKANICLSSIDKYDLTTLGAIRSYFDFFNYAYNKLVALYSKLVYPNTSTGFRPL